MELGLPERSLGTEKHKRLRSAGTVNMGRNQIKVGLNPCQNLLHRQVGIIYVFVHLMNQRVDSNDRFFRSL